MIVLDTSLWIEHLRGSHPGVRAALEAARVASHPWVAGELALGGAGAETLGLLRGLPQAVLAEPPELLELIGRAGLSNMGIGWVDAQLLASALLTPAGRVATTDRKLHAQAERLGVAISL